MTMTTGTNIKATLKADPRTVVYGTVESVGYTGMVIIRFVKNIGAGTWTLQPDTWDVEVVLPPEPSLGTVVRVKHCDGFNGRFIRQDGGWRKVKDNGTFDIFTPNAPWSSLSRNDSVEIESSP